MNVKQEEEEEDGDGKEVSIVEYVSEPLDVNDAGLEAFADVFARFQFPPEESSVCLFLFFSLHLLSSLRLMLGFFNLVAGQT